MEKLKSILRPIHWSLVLRTFIFGGSWLILPLWVFLLVALYFYLFPFFHPVKFAVHFFTLLFFFLSRGFLRHTIVSSELTHKNRSRISLFVLDFLLCQLLLGILILPLNFLYQTAFFFLVAAVLIESVFDYLCGTLTSRRLLGNFSVFLVFSVLILGSAPWSF